MKKLLFILVLGALGYLGYRAYTYQPPPQKRIAPVGTFYLTSYVSTRTMNGIVGLTPGEEVHLVPGGASTPLKRTVSNGKQVVEVDPALLTDDMDLADRLRSSDHQRQTEAQAKAIAEKRASDAAARKRDVEMAKRAEVDLARARAAGTIR